MLFIDLGNPLGPVVVGSSPNLEVDDDPAQADAEKYLHTTMAPGEYRDWYESTKRGSVAAGCGQLAMSESSIPKDLKIADSDSTQNF